MAGITPPGPPGPATLTTAQANEWRDGQLLRATVERGVDRPGQTALLRIGRSQFPVMPQLPLTRGMELLVQVVKQQQMLALKLLELPGALPVPGPRLTEQFLSQIRTLAPRQESPSRLFAVLQAVARAPANADIPAPVRHLARQVMAEMPQARQAEDPAVLRRMVEASINVPRSEATTTRAENAALRVLVTRLAELLAPLAGLPSRTQPFQPPLPTRLGQPAALARWNAQPLGSLSGPQLLAELLAAARGTDARQSLQQLATVEAAAGAEPRWHVEFPVRVGDGIDLVSLVIERERERQSEDDDQKAWQATLALSLPGLGGIQTRIALRQSRVGIDFHVEEHSTLQRLQNELDRLREALAKREVEIAHIAAHLGMLAPSPTPSSNSRLVDINV